MSGLHIPIGTPDGSRTEHAENLLAPQLVRALAWEPPEPISVDTVEAVLTSGGARPWQVELTVAPLTEALSAPD